MRVDNSKGFTLIELSIVLVILAILVGGVLTGRSLMKASELRAVSSESSRYSTAMMAFKDKYFALPGDMSNATAFWGTAAACPGTSATPSTTAMTCNGDGNGQITTTSPTSNESFRYWQHLANAGMVDGSFTGVASSTTATDPNALPGTNTPRSKLSKGGWSVSYLGAIGVSDTTYFDGSFGNSFFMGASTGTTNTITPVLAAEDAMNIDRKIDNGLPATGLVMTLESQGGTCTDLAASSSTSLGASV